MKLHCVTIFILLMLISTGCRSNVTIKKVGSDGRKYYEDTFVFSGGLSAETVNLLGNHLLLAKMKIAPAQFIRELEMLCRQEASPRTYLAMAEASQYLADQLRSTPDTAVSYDLTTLLYTQKYFRHITAHNSTMLFNPEAIIAVKCYNLALTELFSYLKERQLYAAGAFELTAAGGQIVQFDLPEFSLPVKEDKIIYFELCADFRPVNLTHNSRNFGLGVPLICKLKENAIPETTFVDDQVIPATLVIQLESGNDVPGTRRKAKLYYLDSRSTDNISVGQMSAPLAQDFSTPLAYMVQKPQVFNFLQRTFKIEMTKSAVGLYHLEPHHDNRIPIILVHGLMSDIHTWLQLINTLQSDPELRKNYRFMGFSYSSGNPIFISAMQLREALDKEREKLQADNRDLEKFDQMVLIGHSMGGLISRMMISSSNDEILKQAIGRNKYSQFNYNDPEFRRIMIFEPAPYIKRVIFVAVPHRGSELAQSMLGQIASSMIEIPQSLIDFNANIIRDLADIPEKKVFDFRRFNGIDNLSPDGNALRLLNKLPLSEKIPYHSVIGNEEQRGVPGGSDGVVAYSSSHLDGAQSEIVVKSGHSVQQNPLAIQEIKRILKLHLVQLKK